MACGLARRKTALVGTFISRQITIPYAAKIAWGAHVENELLLICYCLKAVCRSDKSGIGRIRFFPLCRIDLAHHACHSFRAHRIRVNLSGECNLSTWNLRSDTVIIKLLRRMSVGKRLATGFGVVLVLMAVLTGVALYGFSELHQINGRLAQQNKGPATTSAEMYAVLRAAVLIIGVLAAVVAVFFSRHVAQMITRPIARAATVSDGIAQGNLAQKVDVNHHGGELGLLLHSMQNTIYRLRELVEAVRDRAEVVQNGTREIARGNAELSSRTEQQASTL